MRINELMDEIGVLDLERFNKSPYIIPHMR